ncbi:hypothetical protein CPB85DRAFT_1445942 [Mucidula mucida]|nr:hypothetical protein CPB85DRAFT_1445942 [Mucidula mucida]
MNTTMQASIQKACPISRLPFDTLVDIFDFATYRPLHPSSLEPSTSPPWLLSHVCSSWRKVALSAPVLWSTVVITSPLSRRATEILAEYLCRSKRHPLRIAVDAARYFKRGSEHEDHCGDSDVPERLMRQLAQESYRWRVVHFEMKAEMFGALAKALSVADLGRLEQCYVVERDVLYWDPAQKPEVAEATALLLQAPHLRKAESRDTDLLAIVSDGVEQLTHLACDLYLLENLPVLSRFANVTELHLAKLSGSDVCAYSNPRVVPLSLPILRHLSVTEPCILAFLTAPALRSLAVREHTHYCYGEESGCCSTYTIDFLVRSLCTLEVLSLLDAEVLLQFDLDLFPVRRVKRLLFPIKDETLTRRIIQKLQGTVLLELRTITLMIHTVESKAHSDLDEDDEKTMDEQVLEKLEGTVPGKRLGHDLVDMLEDRFSKGTLKRVRLYAGDKVSRSLMSMGLRMLQKAGVEVCRDKGNGHEDTCKWWKGPHWFPVVEED